MYLQISIRSVLFAFCLLKLSSCLEIEVPANSVIASPPCGMEHNRGLWKVEGVALKMSDEELKGFQPITTIYFKEENGQPQNGMCQIDFRPGSCRERPSSNYLHCYCRSKVPTGEPGTFFYYIYMQKKAQVSDSRRTLEAVMRSTIKPEADETFDIGNAPTVYQPIRAYYKLDNDRDVVLVDSNEPLEVIAFNRNNPNLKFCVDNLLNGFSLSLRLNGVTRYSSSSCVVISAAFDWSRNTHYDVIFSYNEPTACRRTDQFVGSVRPTAGLPPLEVDGVTVSKNEDKLFKNVETIYCVMLTSMAVIFLIACIIGFIWYRQKTDQIKNYRDEVLQGAMDFDSKFGGSKLDLETSSRSSKHHYESRNQKMAVDPNRMEYSPDKLRMEPSTSKVEYIPDQSQPQQPPSYEQSLSKKTVEEPTNRPEVSLNSKISNLDVELPSDSDSESDSNTQSFKVDLHPISEEMESDAHHVHIEMRGESTTDSNNQLNESNCSDI